MVKILSMLLLGCILGFAGEIKIAVAANVSYAIQELKEAFNKEHPNTKVEVILGSSGKLTAQINNGAPYDLFMSANMKYPEALYREKVATTKPVVYAQGALAMFSVKQLKLSSSLKFLTQKNIAKISIANPNTAPYGKASVEAFKNAGIYGAIKQKLVYAESITQAVQFALTAADVGFIAKSSLYSEKMKQYKEGVNWADVDSKLYTPIKQGIVLLEYAKDSAEAKAFYDFILSNKARKIFQSYGYLIP